LVQKLSLLDALHMVRQAWNKISAKTVANCFHRASITKEARGAEANNILENDEPLIYKPDNMDMADFERYVAIDDGIATESDKCDACAAAESS
ncbi:hypothetical protein GN956_G10035, partial [Arapaima gigas]